MTGQISESKIDFSPGEETRVDIYYVYQPEIKSKGFTYRRKLSEKYVKKRLAKENELSSTLIFLGQISSLTDGEFTNNENNVNYDETKNSQNNKCIFYRFCALKTDTIYPGGTIYIDNYELFQYDVIEYAENQVKKDLHRVIEDWLNSDLDDYTVGIIRKFYLEGIYEKASEKCRDYINSSNKTTLTELKGIFIDTVVEHNSRFIATLEMLKNASE
ncbi:hypothetical protein COEREDRAFT_87638 [Coemansia reversa NRRL 1564]|uniref:Uncharacterized protein n=1 Tax=Coemansia reversa (strain ATCC 12441 / NRRL 1564) TaxID=763665 RepID=A0A2G5B9I1_COERN|nr:hypothetical protein COEREDRAFT_87638 [Coemansia reversa NRRL 1564]|eukprot:PIA15676.1 hypothetical protein COEREDRAFT_87638 [Coemansia reversa NRRL 1564]